MDRLEGIERLARLRDSGVLNEEEYQIQKRRLLTTAHPVNAALQRTPVAAGQTQSVPAAHQVFVHHDSRGDTRAQLEYDASKKSVLVNYLLWFFLSFLSIHRFYVHKWLSGFLQLAVGVIGWVALFPAIFIGLSSVDDPVLNSIALLGTLPFLWIMWILLDAIFIPSWVRRYNQRLVQDYYA
jgi:hypothetical protein